MKKIIILFMVLGLAGFSALNSGGEPAARDLFPEIPGWQKSGEPDIYTPDNLFEYIKRHGRFYRWNLHSSHGYDCPLISLSLVASSSIFR